MRRQCVEATSREGVVADVPREHRKFLPASPCQGFAIWRQYQNGATNMFHLLSCIVQTVPRGVPLGGPAQDPLVVLALDCTNAFNTLSKQGLLNFLQEGC